MLFTNKEFRKRSQRIVLVINDDKKTFLQYKRSSKLFDIISPHKAEKIIKILYYCCKVRIPIQQQQPLQRTVGSGGKPPPAPPRSPSHHTTPAGKQRMWIITTNNKQQRCREQWGVVGNPLCCCRIRCGLLYAGGLTGQEPQAIQQHRHKLFR